MAFLLVEGGVCMAFAYLCWTLGLLLPKMLGLFCFEFGMIKLQNIVFSPLWMYCFLKGKI